MTNKTMLSCEKCGSRNYSTNKTQAVDERLQANKYCKQCKSHTIHRETK